MAAAEEAAFRPSYYGLGSLEMPDAEGINIHEDEDRDFIENLRATAQRKQSAVHDYKYWSGDPQPWRNGTDDSPITDPVVIAREELRKRAAEQEDAAAVRVPWWCWPCGESSEANADRLRGFGIQIDFLLLLTYELDLWEWKTWEVVQFLVKPATEHQNRCRFAELPLVRRFTGPATVFASHCWGAKWGDLVAAVCAGADKARRVVWIDVFAVRQWPGNGADLDFRGVIGRSAATLVAVAPVEGALTTGEFWRHGQADAFLASAEYTEGAAKVLPFCRLWCLVEIFAAIQAKKGLLFRGATVASVDEAGRRVVLAGDAGWGGRQVKK